MQRYPEISDHGMIGDLQTAALISTDGTIDWFCCPRFDSPSLFASLLDAEKGGYFRIAPADSGYVTKQMYVPGTAILVTRFLDNNGVAEVVDFMPVSDESRGTNRHRLARMIRVVRGQMKLVMEVRPRFDYGRKQHRVDISSDGAVFRSDGEAIAVSRVAAPGRSTAEEGTSVERIGDADARVTKVLSAGDVAGLVLEYGADTVRAIAPEEMTRLYEGTVAWWNRWLGRSTYHGRWQEAVTRSAMTLKLLQYAPSGAIVAAPTAGLPEQVGGERNWDYRFTWIRDSSFSIFSLLGLGYVEEAASFLGWLRDRLMEQAGAAADSGPLKIMYRVDGSSDLKEETLDHLEGYKGSRPVRIGNDASDQLQLDIYGEAIDSIHLADQNGLRLGYEGWLKLTDIMSWLCENWDQPDEGIWETRGGRRDFTYGRFMSWVAFDRAIRLARRHGLPSDLGRWLQERDRIYTQIMDRGWNAKKRAFVQSYDSDTLDAANLLMPLLGFVSPTEPRWLSTLDAMSKTLVSDSLVYRYDPSASPDGLKGSEGTFSLCTFFYVDALSRSGQLDEARLTLEKMFTYANHLGLYSEEIGLTGEQLGNFPQAFSHLALINAAINLDHALDSGAVTVPPLATTASAAAGRAG
jgi:GH15 family glucan-1,4-alpha-glucosidase